MIKEKCIFSNKLYTTLLCFVLISAAININAQDVPRFKKSIYTDSEGNVFVNEKMETYLFFAPQTDTSAKHLIPSPSQHANPMFFDRHGEHFITYQDPVSGERIRNRVFADGRPPKSHLNVTSGLLLQFNERFHCEGTVTVEIKAEDEFSGVNKSFYSFDNKEYQLYNEPLIIKENEVEQIKFFSVDNVGNVENPVKAIFIFDVESVIDLENIYFAHDSDWINFEAQKQLDELAEALKRFPEIRIELRSHTDTRGCSVYNQQLSERRAASTRRYLISKGIAPNRLVAKGFGDSIILNHCHKGVECTNEEHRKNRRTEFRIIPFEEQ